MVPARRQLSFYIGLPAPSEAELPVPPDAPPILIPRGAAASGMIVFTACRGRDPTEERLSTTAFEMVPLSLPRAGYPNLVDSARELVDAQFCQPQELSKQVVDLMVAGVEATLERKRQRTARRTRFTSDVSEVDRELARLVGSTPDLPLR